MKKTLIKILVLIMSACFVVSLAVGCNGNGGGTGNQNGGLGGSENAGILATQILALGDKDLAQKLKDYKKEMQAKVLKDDASIQDEIDNI